MSIQSFPAEHLPWSQVDAAQKYMNQPLYLRAVSEQWTIPRNEIQMEMENAVGEGSEREGIVYKGIWRMMPVAAFVRSAPSALRFAPWPALISTS